MPGLFHERAQAGAPVPRGGEVGREAGRSVGDTLRGMGEWPGHAVLQVPIPPLEGPVRARYLQYDASLLAADPAHVHAHLTILGPVPAMPAPRQLRGIAALCRLTAPIHTLLQDVQAFPNGIIHVPPHDPAPWQQLTDAACAIFPDHPPYAGEYRPAPHITIDQVGPQVSLAAVRAELAPMLPLEMLADRLELVWYRAGEVRVLRTWPLDGVSAPRKTGAPPDPRAAADPR